MEFYTKLRGDFSDIFVRNYLVTCQYYPPGNYENLYSTQVAPLDTSCIRPTIGNASLNPNTKKVEIGQKYTVNCLGDRILKDDVNILTCGLNRNFTPPAASFTCITVKNTSEPKCYKPSIDFAIIYPAKADTIREGRKYTVTCSNNNNVKLLTCGSRGNLTPASVTCEAIKEPKKCSTPVVANAVITPNSTTITAGGVYTVKCNEAFKMKGGMIIKQMKCDEDGSLIPASLKCEKSGARRLRTVTSQSSVTALIAITTILYWKPWSHHIWTKIFQPLYFTKITHESICYRYLWPM